MQVFFKIDNNNSMKKKINILSTITYICFLVIIGRLFYLQIIDNNYYLEKLSNKTNKIVYENSSLRGRIYDKNNNLLVDNGLIMTIVYQKKDNVDEVKLAYDISNKIDLDYHKLTNSYLKDFYLMEHGDIINKRVNSIDKENYLKRRITNNEYYKIKKDLVSDDDLSIYNDVDKKAIYLYYLMHHGYSYMEKIIKENCSIEEFMYFSENAHNLHGFSTKYTYGRIYPYKDTFKSILGNVGSVPEENKNYYLSRGYAINDKVGLSNIEFIYDDLLKGKKNMYLIKNNEKILVKEGEKGNDLVLTIDINLQKMVDGILSSEVKKAKNAYNTKYYSHSYVLISDTYGAILSMNGKEYSKGKIIDVAIGNVTDTVTAGSVVKAASMIVGYAEGAIHIGDIMKDECIKIKGTPEKCSIYNMGYVNDIDALAKSSNVYQFKTALKVGKGVYRYNKSIKIDNSAFDTYRDYFKKFGLGVSTGIEFPNESLGYKGSARNPGLLMNFAIGQYDTYTNIQLNQYISTVARDGKRYKMHLLSKIIDNDGNIKEIKPEVLSELNVSKKYVNRVKKGLKAVTSWGTGKSYVNIDSGGKTGTSESFYDSDKNGKIDKETISTNFVMYAPSGNPKVSISINSPNIALPTSSYRYPINQNVIKYITNNIYKYVK